jgi:hypothetical protein
MNGGLPGSEHPAAADLHEHHLLELFKHLSFRAKVRKILQGLQAPRDSGDYLYAKLQLMRLWSPVSAILLPGLLVAALLMGSSAVQKEEDPLPPGTVIDLTPVTAEKPDKMPAPDPSPFKPPDPLSYEDSQKLLTQQPILDLDPRAGPSVNSGNLAGPGPDSALKQTEVLGDVYVVKSIAKMRGPFSSRTPGMREKAAREHGGAVAASGATEGAVIRALRWLQKQQEADGSWKNNRVAMTSFALLTFLAHGETPASEEFGPTVEKAIQFLVKVSNDQHFVGNYEFAIGTYAVTEAYALTRVPMLKPVVEKSVDYIIKSQHATGGWDYGGKGKEGAAKTLTRKDEKTGKEIEYPNPWFDKCRRDTSVMGWCAQALKAAKMAGIKHPQLDEAVKLAVKGFQCNAAPEGGFGYDGPGAGGLSGVGVLCMQLLGAGRKDEARRGLAWLEKNASFDWKHPWGPSFIYYTYYATQAMFHQGGDMWDRWKNQFARELLANQNVIKGGGSGGKDIGFWDTPAKNEHSDGTVMSTCLCALQLEVYYRYLPTYKPPNDADEEADLAAGTNEVNVDVTL